MSDRRSESRKKVMAFVPVYAAPRTLIGYLHDLTLAGAMVIGPFPQPVGATLSIIIEFPPEDLGLTETPFMLPARLARCLPDPESAQSFILGFEFIETSLQNQKIIQALLQRYHFRHQTSE